MDLQYIQSFYVKSLWGIKAIKWNNINEDVNILVGINGCGKTTLLDLINNFYNNQKRSSAVAKEYGGTPITIPLKYIRSFDIPANGKRKTESLLLQSLREIIYQNGDGTSFFDYRMRMVNFPEERNDIEKRILMLFELINLFFKETGKTAKIDRESNRLAFDVEGRSDKTVQIEHLSSGEKQLLLIFFTVFLQNDKHFGLPSVLLAAMLVSGVITFAYRWHLGCKVTVMRRRELALQVLLPCLLVFVVSSAVCFGLVRLLGTSLAALIAILLLNSAALSAIIYAAGLNVDEKRLLKGLVKKMISRIQQI